MYTFNWLLCFESDQLQWLPHNFMFPYVPVRTREGIHRAVLPWQNLSL